MGLAGAEGTANLHDTGGFVLLHIGVFPRRAGGQVGVHVFQLLGGDEADLPVKHRTQLGIADVEPVIGIADGVHNRLDNELQEVQIPIFPGNDLLPIPLVNVNGVDVVQLLIPANGVHVGVQAVAHGKMVPLQGQTLPFGQRMHHLGIGPYGGNVKGHRPLVAVQVVIQAGAFCDEQGSGNTL